MAGVHDKDRINRVISYFRSTANSRLKHFGRQQSGIDNKLLGRTGWHVLNAIRIEAANKAVTVSHIKDVCGRGFTVEIIVPTLWDLEALKFISVDRSRSREGLRTRTAAPAPDLNAKVASKSEDIYAHTLIRATDELIRKFDLHILEIRRALCASYRSEHKGIVEKIDKLADHLSNAQPEETPPTFESGEIRHFLDHLRSYSEVAWRNLVTDLLDAETKGDADLTLLDNLYNDPHDWLTIVGITLVAIDANAVDAKFIFDPPTVGSGASSVFQVASHNLIGTTLKGYAKSKFLVEAVGTPKRGQPQKYSMDVGLIARINDHWLAADELCERAASQRLRVTDGLEI